MESESAAIREKAFIWLGLAGMADPVLHGVRELIGVSHRAGIKTAMLMGDQSSIWTAASAFIEANA